MYKCLLFNVVALFLNSAMHSQFLNEWCVTVTPHTVDIFINYRSISCCLCRYGIDNRYIFPLILNWIIYLSTVYFSMNLWFGNYIKSWNSIFLSLNFTSFQLVVIGFIFLIYLIWNVFEKCHPLLYLYLLTCHVAEFVTTIDICYSLGDGS